MDHEVSRRPCLFGKNLRGDSRTRPSGRAKLDSLFVVAGKLRDYSAEAGTLEFNPFLLCFVGAACSGKGIFLLLEPRSPPRTDILLVSYG